MYNIIIFKVYSNGFRKKLSNQNPVLANMGLHNRSNLKRNYSTSSSSNNSSYSSSRKILKEINPYFITGFSDGKSSFSINILKLSRMRLGLRVNLKFGIVLNSKDLQLLELIKSYFNVGKIKIGKKKCHFIVTSIKDLEVIINHFENYPLVTSKSVDYQLFKLVFEIVKTKNHLIGSGIKKIINLKIYKDYRLGNELLPNIFERPKHIKNVIKNPQWLAGFVSAKENFIVDIINIKDIIGNTNEKINKKDIK